MIKRCGLSLLEVVVAISLLSLVVIFVVELLPTNLYAMIRSQGRLTGENLAHSQLQNQLRQPFSQLPVGLTRQLAEVTIESKVYQSVLQVLPAEAEDPARLRLVRITVTWRDKSTSRRSVREQWIHSAN